MMSGIILLVLQVSIPMPIRLNVEKIIQIFQLELNILGICILLRKKSKHTNRTLENNKKIFTIKSLLIQSNHSNSLQL